MLLLISGCVEYQTNIAVLESKWAVFVETYSTPEMKELIARNEIVIGMNVIEVYVSIGIPHRKNVSTYSWGVYEQWEYLRGGYGRMYLFFENDYLVSWHS